MVSAKRNPAQEASIIKRVTDLSAITSRTMPTTLAVAVHNALTNSKQQPYSYLLAATLMGTGSLVHAQGFPASINLSDLNGSGGFEINGFDQPGGRISVSVSSVSDAGDINNDGIPDLIIGSNGAGPDGKTEAGKSYVVFGGSGVGTSGSLDLLNLDGSNGFVINGKDSGDNSGVSVSAAGDFNGDGVDDLIIGADRADANGLNLSGESYVVYGATEVGSSATLELLSIDGSNGFVIKGYDSVDFLGASVSGAGDINGDGFDDLIVGAPFAYQTQYAPVRGETYVVFGSTTRAVNGTLNVSGLNGRNGFRIQGTSRYDASGESVSGAGDINGDGFDDLIVGAPGGDRNLLLGFAEDTGESYVVFGGANVGSGGVLDSRDLDGGNGFTIFGANDYLQSGASVSGAGDVNGDGMDDLIIGGTGGRSTLGIGNDNPQLDGQSYVVFGGSQVGSSGAVYLDSSVLDGSTGFVLIGSDNDEETVYSVSGAGDVNGDGVADVIVGASDKDTGPSNSRLSFVVFGGMDVGSGGSVNISSLNGSNGFVINGNLSIDLFNTSVSGAGDFNSDGVDDMVIGVPGANNSTGNGVAGASYVIFGNAGTPINPTPAVPPEFDLSQCTIVGTDGPDNLTGTPGADVICGLGGNDRIFALGGDDVIFGGDGDDVLGGGSGDDTVLGEDGKDVITGGAGADRIFGGPKGDRLYGADGNDIISGGAGADRLFGRAGNDQLFGERGRDVLFGGEDNDFLDGGEFNNKCFDTDGLNTFENC